MSRSSKSDGFDMYTERHGWHFNKKLCDYAVSRMMSRGPGMSKMEAIEPWSKDAVEDLLRRNGVVVNNSVDHDCVFVANMAKADYWGSSITDEAHIARYIKDYIDDPDGYEGLPLARWKADIDCMGEAINWESMV